jgi:hypothetical protein
MPMPTPPRLVQIIHVVFNHGPHFQVLVGLDFDGQLWTTNLQSSIHEDYVFIDDWQPLVSRTLDELLARANRRRPTIT